jgi:hypothetical protein
MCVEVEERKLGSWRRGRRPRRRRRRQEAGRQWVLRLDMVSLRLVDANWCEIEVQVGRERLWKLLLL